METCNLADQGSLTVPMHISSKVEGLFDLSGKLALITGAATGIGRVLAHGFAYRGADIAAIDIDQGIEALADEIRALGRRVKVGVCDITKEEQVEAFTNACATEFGHIDVLINNAGINIKSPAVEQTGASFQRVIDVNLVGSFYCCKSAGKIMLKQRKGAIINIASMAGLAALGRGNNFYSATKGAMIALTRELSTEWAPYGVRVNAVAPGWLATDRVLNYFQSQPYLLEQMKARIPVGRMGGPEDLIGPVVFLASDAASMVTGQVLVVDGGVLSTVTLGTDNAT